MLAGCYSLSNCYPYQLSANTDDTSIYNTKLILKRAKQIECVVNAHFQHFITLALQRSLSYMSTNYEMQSNRHLVLLVHILRIICLGLGYASFLFMYKTPIFQIASTLVT